MRDREDDHWQNTWIGVIAILLPDGWHNVIGKKVFFDEEQWEHYPITDAETVDPPGFWFEEEVDGKTVGVNGPYSSILAARWAD